jgi:tetratricopeptide (TPR) repeat protein
MTTLRIHLTALICLLGIGSALARAAGNAVVVGIADFEDPGITDLKFTARDAAVFADYLRRPSGGDLAAGRVRVLLDSAATLAAIQSALAWQLETASPDAPSYLYLATHGDVEAEQINTGGYLLAYDTPRNNYELLALSVGFLNDHITRLAAKGVTVIVVTDACHAGTLAGDAVAGRTLTAARLMQRLDSEVRLLSCQPYELAREGRQWGDGRGAFSYHLIRGLEGAADADRDRRIDLFELEQYVEQSVSKDTERQQHPALVGGRKDWSISTVSQESERGVLSERSAEVAEDFLTSQLALTGPEVQRTYLRFRRAVAAGKLTTPAERCAQTYFWQLRGEPALLPLRGLLDEAYTVPLLDSVQQAIQDYLEADADELMQREELDEKYLAFPDFLAEAAAVIGPTDPRYPALVAKRLYFEGLIRRLRTNFTVLADTLLASADSLLTAAIALAPDAAYIQNEWGIVNEKLGRDSLAETAYRRAQQLAPTWALPYNNLGNLLTDRDPEARFSDAARAYERAIRLRPDLGVAYMNYGVLHRTVQRPDSAAVLFEQAVAVTPELIEARYNLASVLATYPDRWEEAVRQYRSVLTDRPRRADAFYGLGYLYEHNSTLDSALANYLKAAALEDDALSDLLYPALARSFLALDPPAGKAFFTRLRRQKPLSPFGYAFSAVLDTVDQSWQTALTTVELDEEEHYDLIAGAVEKLFFFDRSKLSVAAARVGTKTHPNYLGAYTTLTVILVLDGQINQAEKAFRDALSVAKRTDTVADFCAEISTYDYYDPLLERPRTSRLFAKYCPEADITDRED